MSKIVITVDDDEKVSVEHEGCDGDLHDVGALHFALVKEVARLYDVNLGEATFIIGKMTTKILLSLLSKEEE
ncbi:MAG: hypothetical protein ACI3U2_06895 [Anaerovibrio sp.]